MNIYSTRKYRYTAVGKFIYSGMSRILNRNTKPYCHNSFFHICGIAGHIISNQWSRISGLEPPYQRFNAKPNVYRLDYYNADIVGIITLATFTKIEIQLDCPALDFDFGKCSQIFKDCYYSQSM